MKRIAAALAVLCALVCAPVVHAQSGYQALPNGCGTGNWKDSAVHPGTQDQQGNVCTKPTNGSVSLLAGSAIIGKVGIDQTTPGTTNGVQTLTGSTTAVTQATAANLNATVIGSYINNSSQIPPSGVVVLGYDPTNGKVEAPVTDPLGHLFVAQDPYATTIQTPVTAHSATTGNTANAATLSGTSTTTVYVSGMQCTAGGATALSLGTIVLSGLLGGSESFAISFPAGVTLAAAPVIVSFNPPLAASAVNTPIVATLPAAGSGNTFEACNLQGLYQ